MLYLQGLLLNLRITELIKRHPSDAAELIKGFTFSFWNGMGCQFSTMSWTGLAYFSSQLFVIADKTTT